MVPITVPPGTTQVRVKYCWRDPDGLTSTARSTLDLGLWQPAPGARPWGTPEFRGWGGSSHGDVAVSRQGFSSEAQYVGEPERVRARTHDARVRPGSHPGRPVGGRARRRLRDRSGGRQPDRTDPLARRGRAQARPGVRGDALPARPLRPAAREARAGLVRRRPARPRRAQLAGQRDDARGLRVRVQAARPGWRGPGLRLAHRLRHDERLGRDRPPPARLPGQAGPAQRRGHHLPRPLRQPREPALRRPPHRPRLRASSRRRRCGCCGRRRRRGRASPRSTGPAGSSRSTTRGSSTRRRPPGSPPSAAAARGSTPTPRPTGTRSTPSRSRPGRRTSARARARSCCRRSRCTTA